jgi:hypothetical protein
MKKNGRSTGVRIEAVKNRKFRQELKELLQDFTPSQETMEDLKGLPISQQLRILRMVRTFGLAQVARQIDRTRRLQ